MATRAGSLRVPLVSLLMVFAVLTLGSEAARAGTCGDRVVADWIDGRIDGVYQLRCYEEAVDGLPEDVRVYSSAVDDISRALQARVHSVSEREAAGEINSQAVASPAGSSAAQPPLTLLLVVASVSLFLVAGAGTWIAQSRRRRT